MVAKKKTIKETVADLDKEKADKQELLKLSAEALRNTDTLLANARKRDEYLQESKISPHIVRAIAEIQATLRPIEKVQKATDGRGKVMYNFRGIDDVLASLNPLLVANGVFILPNMVNHTTELINVGNRPAIKTVVHMQYIWVSMIDNSRIMVEMGGESLDYSDKGTAQAMSTAYKMMMFQMLCIPTYDIKDNDSQNIEIGVGGKKSPTSTAQVEPSNQQAKKLSADQFTKLYTRLKELTGETGSTELIKFIRANKSLGIEIPKDMKLLTEEEGKRVYLLLLQKLEAKEAEEATKAEEVEEVEEVQDSSESF